MAALVLLCVWVLVASVIGFAPRRFHWRGAIVLMLTAVPLLWWVYLELGPLWTLGAFAAMASILRWPGLFLIRKIGRLVGLGAQK
jgi:isoprenylcysteine carboxyl methyltransferase (ICMT) family protein YpbQ